MNAQTYYLVFGSLPQCAERCEDALVFVLFALAVCALVWAINWLFD